MPAAYSISSNLPPSRRGLLLSRDKTDTLLLLGACLMVIVPHVAYLAWWNSLSFLLLLGWRGWLTLSGRRLPPQWLLLPIAAALMLGVYLQQHSLFGRDAGVAMLVLLLTCKLLEMHARRDLFVVLFLDFFLLLTGFFHSQGIGSAVFAAATLAILLTAQITFQYAGASPSLWSRLKLALLILGLALPLTIVAFVLFPRIQGPLWSLPGDARSGRSGLTDTVAPGNLSELALSDEIAFRVKFLGPAPDRSQMYWRGIVLENFDGRTWTRRSVPAPRRKTDQQFAGLPISQEIILEPSGQPWLFALDMPANPPALDELRPDLNGKMELRSAHPVGERLRYQVFSYLQYGLQRDLRARNLAYALQLPAEYNPRTLAFAAELRRRSADDLQLIEQVLQFFRREKFSYTLEPAPLGVDSVDDFLFRTREGFCEHYASAFAVLMRAAGVPSRVVAGYQGGSLNVIDGYMEVRQANAHAWTEVWLAGKGWIRVDPTVAVDPARIRLNAMPARRGLAGMVDFGGNTTLAMLRMRWDALNNSWNQWVLNYNQATQKDLMSTLGLADLDWPQLMMVFLAVATLAMAALGLPLTRNRPQIGPLDKVYSVLCNRLAQRGYPRAVHEGPFAYALRLRQSRQANDDDPVQKFLALYTAAKYGKNPVPAALLIARLKALLAQCP